MAPSLYHALSTGKLNWAGTNAPELKLFYYLLWYAFGQSQVAPSLMMSVHTLENSTDQELLSIEDMYEAIVFVAGGKEGGLAIGIEAPF